MYLSFVATVRAEAPSLCSPSDITRGGGELFSFPLSPLFSECLESRAEPDEGFFKAACTDDSRGKFRSGVSEFLIQSKFLNWSRSGE